MSKLTINQTNTTYFLSYRVKDEAGVNIIDIRLITTGRVWTAVISPSSTRPPVHRNDTWDDYSSIIINSLKENHFEDNTLFDFEIIEETDGNLNVVIKEWRQNRTTQLRLIAFKADLIENSGVIYDLEMDELYGKLQTHASEKSVLSEALDKEASELSALKTRYQQASIQHEKELNILNEKLVDKNRKLIELQKLLHDEDIVSSKKSIAAQLKKILSNDEILNENNDDDGPMKEDFEPLKKKATTRKSKATAPVKLIKNKPLKSADDKESKGNIEWVDQKPNATVDEDEDDITSFI